MKKAGNRAILILSFIISLLPVELDAEIIDTEQKIIASYDLDDRFGMMFPIFMIFNILIVSM